LPFSLCLPAGTAAAGLWAQAGSPHRPSGRDAYASPAPVALRPIPVRRETAAAPADSGAAAENFGSPPWSLRRSAWDPPGSSCPHNPAASWHGAPVAASRENLLCGQHRVAMDGHSVFHAPRIAAGVCHHYRDLMLLGNFHYQFVALLQSVYRE